jgi:hypothetical protein
MLQQGGRFKFDGKQFDVRLRERILNSIGQLDGGVVKVPGERTF